MGHRKKAHFEHTVARLYSNFILIILEAVLIWANNQFDCSPPVQRGSLVIANYRFLSDAVNSHRQYGSKESTHSLIRTKAVSLLIQITITGTNTKILTLTRFHCMLNSSVLIPPSQSIGPHFGSLSTVPIIILTIKVPLLDLQHITHCDQ